MQAYKFNYISQRSLCSFIVSSLFRLTPDNVVGIRAFADTLNCTRVVEETDKYIQKNFVAVSKSEEFSQLGISDVLSILSRDELHIESEEQVYNVMMNWIRKDTEMRSVHLPQLLKCVRMPLLTPQFITDYVASEALIKGSHQCRFGFHNCCYICSLQIV